MYRTMHYNEKIKRNLYITTLKLCPSKRYSMLLLRAGTGSQIYGGGTSKKGHKKGRKWTFLVCVNLKKDPNRHLRPPTNMHSTIEVIVGLKLAY